MGRRAGWGGRGLTSNFCSGGGSPHSRGPRRGTPPKGCSRDGLGRRGAPPGHHSWALVIVSDARRTSTGGGGTGMILRRRTASGGGENTGKHLQGCHPGGARGEPPLAQVVRGKKNFPPTARPPPPEPSETQARARRGVGKKAHGTFGGDGKSSPRARGGGWAFRHSR